jgi:hypothetical protein
MLNHSQPPELAFYYPNPIWMDGDWVKNLLLFFDGIALLVPSYMKDSIEEFDPAIVSGLREHNLLHIIEPEEAVDKAAAEALASVMIGIIASGSLDSLARDSTAFREISRSRMGYYGNEDLAQMIFVELKKRGLAQESKDGVSIPMHPLVRSLVLTLLSQILRPFGQRLQAELNPVTDRSQLVASLVELLNLPTSPGCGNVVSFDLATVGVDLASVPMNEIVSFRQEHKAMYSDYRRSVRQFAYELSKMSKEERDLAFEARQAELDRTAADLRRLARSAWKKAASFAMTLAGAAWTFVTGDHLGAILAGGGALVGVELSGHKDVGAYSYLFRARERYPY